MLPYFSRASIQGIYPGHLSRHLAKHTYRGQAASGVASLGPAAAIAAEASAGILAGSKSDAANFAERSAGLLAVSDKSLTEAAIAARWSFNSAMFLTSFLRFIGKNVGISAHLMGLEPIIFGSQSRRFWVTPAPTFQNGPPTDRDALGNCQFLCQDFRVFC